MIHRIGAAGHQPVVVLFGEQLSIRTDRNLGESVARMIRGIVIVSFACVFVLRNMAARQNEHTRTHTEDVHIHNE